MIPAWNRMLSQWKCFQSFQHLPIHHLLLSALNNVICKLQYFLLHFYVNFQAHIPIYPDTPGAVGCCVIFRIKNVEGFSIFQKCKRSVLTTEIKRDPTITRSYFVDVFRISLWKESFPSIVETSDAPLNVITIFFVSCRTITVIIYTINFVFELILNHISNYF